MDRTTATQTIATIIAGPSNETDPADFDLDAIADELYTAAGGTWDFQDVDSDIFWATVENNAR